MLKNKIDEKIRMVFTFQIYFIPLYPSTTKNRRVVNGWLRIKYHSRLLESDLWDVFGPKQIDVLHL